MNPIVKKIENKRLKLDLNLHVINENVMINISKKFVQGQIQSFKSDKVLDAISDQGVPQAASVSAFQMNVENFDNLEDQVQNYLELNIDKFVSL